MELCQMLRFQIQVCPKGCVLSHPPFFLLCTQTFADLTKRAATWWNFQMIQYFWFSSRGQSQTMVDCLLEWWKLILMWTKPKSLSLTWVKIVENQIVLGNKYLGTLFDSQLKCDKNIESIVKRGQQRIHLLRKLNFFNVYNNILCMFYQTFIESILTFPFICWFGGLPVKDKNSLFSIVKVC